VRVSTSLNSAYAVDDPRLGAAQMVERARAAHAAGLEGLYLGDHHATPVPYYQNSPMLGRLAAEWPDRRFGALYLLPLWHPLVVAEQIGTLAALGTGTFVFQCAVGGGRDQFGPMGVELAERAKRFEAALEAITALLTGEVVDDPDGPWGLREARISPTPAEPVEIWIGGAGSRALDRAARMGHTWYAGPELTDDVASDKLAEYLEAARHEAVEPPCLPIRRDIYVGADEDDVARIRGPLEAHGHRGFDLSAVVTGTVDQVAERFLSLGERGFDEVVVRQLAPHQADAVASIERLSEVVDLVAAA
jgi:alkanesulfonate monooxygenase SsuD/methylene tetrahydromethanopterin reductase-like flavin-dependent oxidoreductase (luciferase family)